MADTIKGPVINVVDGDTFDMHVTHLGENNKEKYNDDERVRIAGIDAQEINTKTGKIEKEKLENKLNGKKVLCKVQSRDSYGRIVAEIEIL